MNCHQIVLNFKIEFSIIDSFTEKLKTVIENLAINPTKNDGQLLDYSVIGTLLLLIEVSGENKVTATLVFIEDVYFCTVLCWYSFIILGTDSAHAYIIWSRIGSDWSALYYCHLRSDFLNNNSDIVNLLMKSRNLYSILKNKYKCFSK